MHSRDAQGLRWRRTGRHTDGHGANGPGIARQAAVPLAVQHWAAATKCVDEHVNKTLCVPPAACDQLRNAGGCRVFDELDGDIGQEQVGVGFGDQANGACCALDMAASDMLTTACVALSFKGIPVSIKLWM